MGAAGNIQLHIDFRFTFLTACLSWLGAGVGRRPFAQVLRNSLSGHPPTTGLRDIFRFTPVVYYRVIVMGRFWTTWRVVKWLTP